MLYDSTGQLSAIIASPGPDSADCGSTENDHRPRIPCAAVAALVREAQGGERAAQAELVRRYQHRVAGFVHKMIRRRSAVEDIAQTVMIRMIRRLPYLREPDVFESWLFRMARNEVLDTFRRIKCRVPTVDAESECRELCDGSNSQAHFEIKDAVNYAIECLAQREREIIQRVIAGHSYEAIAAHTGLTASAVKIRVFRIRLILRPRMLEALGRDVSADQAKEGERSTPKSKRRRRRGCGRKSPRHDQVSGDAQHVRTRC